jgi:hypothetical protein
LSALHTLQVALGRAEGQRKRAQTKLEDLRAQYRNHPNQERPDIVRRGLDAKMEFEEAERAYKRAWDALHAEEMRLMQSDAFLAFP